MRSRRARRNSTGSHARDVACSALRRDHRASLVRNVTALTAPGSARWISCFLVEKAKLENRLKARQEKVRKFWEEVNGHFFPASCCIPARTGPRRSRFRTICHVFDAETRSSPSAAASALAATLDALLSSRAEWDATARAFLDDWYGRLERLTGGLANLVRLESNVQIDHVCFRCASEASYHDALASLERAGHVVAGSSSGRSLKSRRCSLRPPPSGGGSSSPRWRFPCPSPAGPSDGQARRGGARAAASRAEHLIRLRKTYLDAPWDAKGLGKALNAELSCSLPGGPAMAVKFHHRPLLEVMAHEIERGMAKAPPRLASGFASDARLGGNVSGNARENATRISTRPTRRTTTRMTTRTTTTRTTTRSARGTIPFRTPEPKQTPHASARPHRLRGPARFVRAEMREPWAGMVTRGEKTTETPGTRSRRRCFFDLSRSRRRPRRRDPG